MATFFFISGYIYQNFGKGNLSLGQKIQKRLIAYGIPYIVFSIVYYLVKIVLSSFVNTTISLEEIVFIPVKPFGYLWFVYALMFMEILQDIVEHVFTNKKKSVYVGKCLFFCIVFLRGHHIFSVEIGFQPFDCDGTLSAKEKKIRVIVKQPFKNPVEFFL